MSINMFILSLIFYFSFATRVCYYYFQFFINVPKKLQLCFMFHVNNLEFNPTILAQQFSFVKNSFVGSRCGGRIHSWWLFLKWILLYSHLVGSRTFACVYWFERLGCFLSCVTIGVTIFYDYFNYLFHVFSYETLDKCNRNMFHNSYKCCTCSYGLYNFQNTV